MKVEMLKRLERSRHCSLFCLKLTVVQYVSWNDFERFDKVSLPARLCLPMVESMCSIEITSLTVHSPTAINFMVEIRAIIL